ncbi:hypothetical protein HKD37_12G034989 [Glycine soja]
MESNKENIPQGCTMLEKKKNPIPHMAPSFKRKMKRVPLADITNLVNNSAHEQNQQSGVGVSALSSAEGGRHQWCCFVVLTCRDSNGNFISAVTSCFNGIPSPSESEVRSLELTLNWLSSGELSNIILMSDCKQNIDSIKARRQANQINRASRPFVCP